MVTTVLFSLHSTVLCLLKFNRERPELWDGIRNSTDLVEKIITPFWSQQKPVSERIIHFRYKLYRLMETIMDKQFKPNRRNAIPLAHYHLPKAWVPVLPVGDNPNVAEEAVDAEGGTVSSGSSSKSGPGSDDNNTNNRKETPKESKHPLQRPTGAPSAEGGGGADDSSDES